VSRKSPVLSWLTLALTAAVCVGIVVLSAFAYRATRQWQRSSALLIERQQDDGARLLVTAVTRDMRGAQTSVLSDRDWGDFSSDSPYDATDVVEAAFARYPVHEPGFGRQLTKESGMKWNGGTIVRTAWHGALLALVAVAWHGAAIRAQGDAAPKYEVDPNWPKPFPDRWVIGGLGGLCVDANDHVLILNRQDVLDADLNAGHLAPPMIELDGDGNVVRSWGDPKLIDPRLHSCFFDKSNDVWIASSPSGMVQKYSHDGSKLLFQIGQKGVLDSSDGTDKGQPLNSNAAKFFMPSSIYEDPQNGDIYVSDGESRRGNHRIAVIARSGKFLRQWNPQGMQTVHCLSVSNDGLVYVCNREGARIQVYDKMGKFLKNIDIPWKPYTTPGDGTPKDTGGAAVSLDFSRDPTQRLMYLINQNTSEIEVINRETGKIVSSFGRAGHFAGHFDQPHGIAVDSKGNVYVAENRGRRVQKFRIIGQ
jgi:NHL repeat-containing protein